MQALKEKHFYQKKLFTYSKRLENYRKVVVNLKAEVSKIKACIKRVEKIEVEVKLIKQLVIDFTHEKISTRKNTPVNPQVLGLFYKYCSQELQVPYTSLLKLTNNKDRKKASLWSNEIDKKTYRQFKQFVKLNDNDNIIYPHSNNPK